MTNKLKQSLRPTTETLLEGIRTLVEIESYTHDFEAKNKLKDFLIKQYQDAGFPVECLSSSSDTDHILAHSPWGGEGKGILVLSHYDTVHPTGTLKTFPYAVKGDHAYGPGILDMKAGLHLAMRAMADLAMSARSKEALPIRHLIVSDEENCSKSSRQAIEQEAKRAKYVLVTEPAGRSSCITTARKGSLRFSISALGQAAHSGSRHQDGRSAILEAAHQVIALEALTDYDAGVTANCGLIQGGLGVNTIPDRCDIKLDIRFANPDSVEPAMQAVQGLTSVNPDVRLEIEGRINRPAFPRLPMADKLVNEIQEAGKRCGLDLGEFQSGGGSDANLTCQIAPTVCGMGSEGEGAHTLSERIDIASLLPRYALLHDLMHHLR